MRILPDHIRNWLRRHGLFWCCFCPLESGSSASCQIVHCNDGTVKAYCTDFPPKCGFRGKFLSFPQSTFSDHLFLVNLTRIYGSALLTSEYPHLPTLGMSGTAIASLPNVNILVFLQASGRKPDLDNFVLAFQSAAPFGPGPYFEGYCGEHVSQHPGKEQKAGPFGHSGIFLPFFLCGSNQTLTRPIRQGPSPLSALYYWSKHYPSTSARHNGLGGCNVGNAC